MPLLKHWEIARTFWATMFSLDVGFGVDDMVGGGRVVCGRFYTRPNPLLSHTLALPSTSTTTRAQTRLQAMTTGIDAVAVEG